MNNINQSIYYINTEKNKRDKRKKNIIENKREKQKKTYFFFYTFFKNHQIHLDKDPLHLSLTLYRTVSCPQCPPRSIHIAMCHHAQP